MDAVGVLIFVDHDIFEAALIVGQHLAVALQDDEHVQQQIAEIAGVERDQAGLIGGVEFLPAAIGVEFALAGIDLRRREAFVLPAVDQPGKLARGPAFLVEIGGLDELLQQAQLVVGVEDGEVAVQADEFGMAAQHLGADRVEGAEPRHPLDHIADQPPDAVAHLARGLVGEGDAEDLARPGFAGGEQMREPRGERGGLAGAGPGQHQHRAFGGQHGFALLRVEARQIGGILGRGRGESHW
ncbi:hypothetical protein D9M73_131980 [compost metagenome]